MASRAQGGERPPEVLSEFPPDQIPQKVISDPGQPSPQEFERHCACGHVPFRSWCPICVKCSAPEDGHRAQGKATHEFPVFSNDYAFLGSKDQSEKLTIHVTTESNLTKSMFCTVVPRKGIGETEVAINYMLDCIAEFGYTSSKIYLINDQEPAIQAVIQGVIRRRTAPTLIEESPVGSSQSNGAAERAVLTAERGIRKLRTALETHYKAKLQIDDDVITWLVLRCARWLYLIFLILSLIHI